MTMSRQTKLELPKTEFIQVEGKSLEYYYYQPEVSNKAVTLIFLHEGLGSTTLWRDFPIQLANATGCKVLVYNRSGYGQSDAVTLPRPTEYMHIEAKNVLPALIAALGIEEHILVGHSDGASIALIYAGHEANSKLKAVISEAAHVFVEDISIASIEAVRQPYNAGLKEKLAKYHKHVDNAFWGWNDVWLSDDFRQWNIEDYLSDITVPVLVIQGYDDEYGTEKQVDSIVNTCAKAEKLMLKECGHSPHKDQTGIVLEAMKNFVLQLVL